MFSLKDITRQFCRFYLSLTSPWTASSALICVLQGARAHRAGRGGAGCVRRLDWTIPLQNRKMTQWAAVSVVSVCRAGAQSGHRANARYVRLQVEACLRACSSLLLNFHGFDKQAASYYHLMAMFCISF